MTGRTRRTSRTTTPETSPEETPTSSDFLGDLPSDQGDPTPDGDTSQGDPTPDGEDKGEDTSQGDPTPDGDTSQGDPTPDGEDKGETHEDKGEETSDTTPEDKGEETSDTTPEDKGEETSPTDQEDKGTPEETPKPTGRTLFLYLDRTIDHFLPSGTKGGWRLKTTDGTFLSDPRMGPDLTWGYPQQKVIDLMKHLDRDFWTPTGTN